MIVTTWRIIKKRFAASAFTGEGALEYGGRWNSPGIPVVYTAQSISLAALEMLMHIRRRELGAAYLLYSVEIDSSLVESVSEERLPSSWARQKTSRHAREIGDRWVMEGRSVALQVPSAIIPSEANFMLNPNHPDFGQVQIRPPRRFRFDPRLARLE